jgi:surface polysaccharide O-acyltransferase-like enzyme
MLNCTWEHQYTTSTTAIAVALYMPSNSVDMTQKEHHEQTNYNLKNYSYIIATLYTDISLCNLKVNVRVLTEQKYQNEVNHQT